MESLRVFLVTTQDFYVYNPDKMLAAVPEAINGYDTYFGPRTMRTEDARLDTEMERGEGIPLWDNWNKFGGSRDVYGDYQRKMLREYGSWNHPQTGIPMEVNAYWSEGRETDPWDRHGEVDVEYDDVIPEGAVDYIPAERKWLNSTELVEEGYLAENTADVKVTIDLHEKHVWHDGTDFELQDVMAAYARDKELGNDTHEPYLSAWEGEMETWWDSISAIEWNEDEGTYTVYGDYSFPVEDLIGDHYSMFPEVHPLTYEGWNQLHGGDDTEYGGIVDTDYDYEPREGYEWIHQISSSQNEDLVTVLEAMRDDEWIPYYLRAENNAPIPMYEAELTTQLDSVIDFIETYEHSYIGMGPFMLENYDASNRITALTQWNQYGYPFDGEEAVLDNWKIDITSPVDGSGFVEGDEVTVNYTVDAQYEDTQDIVFMVDGEEVDSEELTLGEGERETAYFEYGYWADQFEIKGVRLDCIDAPDEAALGDEIEASGTGVWEESFPEPEEKALEEEDLDNYRYTLRGEFMGEIYETVPMEEIELTPEDGFSTFDATIPTDNVQAGSTYTLHLEARAEEDDPWTMVSHKITLSEEDLMLADTDDITSESKEYTGTFTWTATAGDHLLEVATDDESTSVAISVAEDPTVDEPYFEVTIDEPEDGAEFEKGDEVTVEYTVENTGDEESTQDIVLYVDGDEEDVEEDVTLDVDGTYTGEFTWEADDESDYHLEVASDDDSDTVAVTVEEEDDGIPGFTLALLALGVIVAGAIYWKKKPKRGKGR